MNGQIVSPVEVNSSSSHVITIKGSSVWLHWNYTYIGDGVHGPLAVTYKEQIIGFNTTLQPTIKTIAKRTGQNGALTLELPVPAPYNRRVEMISANNTFVIHGLQYNDSAYQLSSFVSVNVDAGLGAVPNIIFLKPGVSITVNGMSLFRIDNDEILYRGEALKSTECCLQFLLHDFNNNDMSVSLLGATLN